MTHISTILTLLLVLAVFLLAEGCTNTSEIPFEFPGSTTIVAQGVTSLSDLNAKGVQNPESLNIPGGIPGGIKRFDLVTFNHPALNEELESGLGLPVRIRGKEYLANVTRMTFQKIDNGIYSYQGSLDGEKNSDVLLTVSQNVILGHVSVNRDETFWIEPVENRSRGESSPSTLHIIYSSKDVKPHYYIIDYGTISICPTTVITIQTPLLIQTPLSEKEQAEQLIADAEDQIKNVDAVIAWFKGNESTLNDAQLPIIITKREVAASYLSTAKDEITNNNYVQARVKAQEAFEKAKESYKDAMMRSRGCKIV